MKDIPQDSAPSVRDISGMPGTAEAPDAPEAKEDPQPASSAPVVALICGIAACVLNIFVITVPLGFIFGFVAIVSGSIAPASSRGRKAGLALGAVSMLILFVYAASVLFPFWIDPTERALRD